MPLTARMSAGTFSIVGRIERLAGRRRGEAIQPAVLIADDDAAFVVGAEIDPRALLDAGHRVEQLDLESLWQP